MTLISAVFQFIFIANDHLILKRTKVLIKKKNNNKIKINPIFLFHLKNIHY